MVLATCPNGDVACSAAVPPLSRTTQAVNETATCPDQHHRRPVYIAITHLFTYYMSSCIRHSPSSLHVIFFWALYIHYCWWSGHSEVPYTDRMYFMRRPGLRFREYPRLITFSTSLYVFDWARSAGADSHSSGLCLCECPFELTAAANWNWTGQHPPPSPSPTSQLPTNSLATGNRNERRVVHNVTWPCFCYC